MRNWLSVTILFLGLSPSLFGQQAPTANRHLLIVLDGLRPDYISPELTPNIYALGQRGVVFGNHHASFPTVTGANGATITTGAYPELHGVLGNSLYIPEIDESQFVEGGQNRPFELHRQVEGGYLTATSFLDALANAGRRTLGVGEVVYLAMLDALPDEGAYIHWSEISPAWLRTEIENRLGPWPEPTPTRNARNRHLVDAFLEIGLVEIDPEVTFMWLSEPDASAHAFGIGHPTMLSSLRQVDEEIGRIERRLGELGLLDETNIWIDSDHGFATLADGFSIEDVLRPFQRDLEDGSPRIVQDRGQIYVRDGDREVIRGIVAALQEHPGVGAVFTAPRSEGDLEGWVEGTLSFNVIRWGHERAADIVYSPFWTHDENEHGFAGLSGPLVDRVAAHGTSGPYDIHNTLIVAGPDLRTGHVVEAPSSNADIAPTILHLAGVERPASMQGRVMLEALVSEMEAEEATVERTQITVDTPSGYRLRAFFSSIGDHRYLDYTETLRVPGE